jgi:hypothetical protein
VRFLKRVEIQVLAAVTPEQEEFLEMLFVGYRREGPIGDSLFMRAAGAVFPKYAQTPRNLTHPINDRKFDHQSQYSNWSVRIKEIGWQKTEVR